MPPVNFYRAVQSREPPAIAQAVALDVHGRAPDKWPKERLAGMAAFFSQIGYKSTAEWKEEIVYLRSRQDRRQHRHGVASRPAKRTSFPTANAGRACRPDQDPREVFADWLHGTRRIPGSRATS